MPCLSCALPSVLQLALRLHPDKNKALRSDEAFKLLSKAFSCLSNADKRAYYDRYGRSVGASRWQARLLSASVVVQAWQTLCQRCGVYCRQSAFDMCAFGDKPVMQRHLGMPSHFIVQIVSVNGGDCGEAQHASRTRAPGCMY